ncbi:serine O-acetyltransferase EpsC [Croceiramulus getboli]|nr:serine acetyltransferase [Flavobacteriaceae bacterium YJPT1-3]
MKDSSSLLIAIEKQKKQMPIAFALKDRSQQFTELLYRTLFDQDTSTQEGLAELERQFQFLRDLACPDRKNSPCKRWDDFCKQIPKLFADLKLDAQSIYENDPAAQSIEEVYLAYPGFFAIAVYRMAHQFHQFGLPLIPRLMTEYAHQLTGIDIHPGARIGTPFFIDHGTGVVIGETTYIHDHVKIYQGVTLGALTVDKKLEKVKRHPTIESYVTLYANATVLGGATVIGAHSIIGGNAWITDSVPPRSRVTHQSKLEVRSQSNSTHE